MLDEIIDYVKFLQLQVKVNLSLSLSNYFTIRYEHFKLVLL